MRIEESVIVITGASGGIGESTARRAAARHARTVLVARSAGRLRELEAELPDSVAVVADITGPDAPERIVAAARERFGAVHALVNNAGQGLHVPVSEVDPEAFAEVLDLNVVAQLRMLQAMLPEFRRAGGGAVVNVSSGTARMPFPGLGAYAASKAALTMLSAVARQELAAEGVTVSTIFPPIVATAFHEHLRQGSLSPQAAHIPPVAPEIVADAILELLESGDAERRIPPA